MNLNHTNDISHKKFPSSQKFPIIKNSNVPSFPLNPSNCQNIKIPRTNYFNKTTSMSINPKNKKICNFERENINNNIIQDDTRKKTKEISDSSEMTSIKSSSSESSGNLREITSNKSLGNIYCHKALIPIGVVVSNEDINYVNSNMLKSSSQRSEDHSDSFINELEDLLVGVNNKGHIKSEEVKNSNVIYGNNNIHIDKNYVEENQQPDPRINFEQINEVNKLRPQTSYGGLNARRKKLQTALKSAKYRTNNNINNNNHNVIEN